jgi:hypothetical protein
MTEATLEIKEGRYFSRIWFIGYDTGNYLAALWRDEGESRWHLTYRFRHRRDEKAHDSDDEIRRYHVTGKPEHDEASMIDLFDTFILPNAKLLLSVCEITTIAPESSDPERVMQLIAAQPWAHIRPTGIGGDA